MFVIRIGHVVAILLVLTHSSNSTFVGEEKHETEISFEMVGDYLRLPWLEGIDWLTNSTESAERKKARTLIRGIESGEPWAMRILNTLAEDESIIPQKNIQHHHTHIQCTRDDADIIKIQSEHCTDPMTTVSERSVSTTCTNECTEFSSAVNNASVSHKLQNDRTVNDTAAERSSPVGSRDFTTPEIFTIFFFVSVAVMLLGCTVCDFVKRKGPGDRSATINTMAKFSLYTNAIGLLRPTQAPGTMPAIHGIRCLCSVLIIYSHRLLIVSIAKEKEISVLDILIVKSWWFGVYLEMTAFAVESFCVISGFFTAYIFFHLKQSGTKFNILTMYFHRYWRITPSLAVIILFVAVFVPHLGSGPLWENTITAVVEPCLNNWWVNLLYVQNFVTETGMCLPHTWYLAIDMQLFWLSPLILYPLHRWPKFGIKVLGLFIVISAITPAIVLAFKDYANVWLRPDKNFTWHAENAFFYYIPTYNRACAHLIGMLLGYVLFIKKRNLSKVNVAINWIAAGSLVVFCTWSINRAYNSAFAYDLSMEMTWAVLLRPSWSIATAWVVYACTQGYGGLVTRFLSMPIFVPLSRLSFTICLVHAIIQVITITTSQSPFSLQNITMFHYGIFCDVLLSVAAAFVLHLFIESPAIVLAKIFIKKNGRQQEPEFRKRESEKKTT